MILDSELSTDTFITRLIASLTGYKVKYIRTCKYKENPQANAKVEQAIKDIKEAKLKNVKVIPFCGLLANFLKQQKMKKIFIFLVAMACLTSCKEQFSNGERVGTVTKFSKAGVFWDSWDGLLNVTQTGMNSSGEPFAFSMDNDRNDQQKLISTLTKAQVEGWKVKIKYHQVWGCKNVFKNRGESDYFVDDVIILDKNFSKIGDIVKGTNKTAPHDTLYVKIVK